MAASVVDHQFSSPSVMSFGDMRPDDSRYEVMIGGMISPSKNTTSMRFFTLALSGMKEGM